MPALAYSPLGNGRTYEGGRSGRRNGVLPPPFLPAIVGWEVVVGNLLAHR